MRNIQENPFPISPRGFQELAKGINPLDNVRLQPYAEKASLELNLQSFLARGASEEKTRPQDEIEIDTIIKFTRHADSVGHAGINTVLEHCLGEKSPQTDSSSLSRAALLLTILDPDFSHVHDYLNHNQKINRTNAHLFFQRLMGITEVMLNSSESDIPAKQKAELTERVREMIGYAWEPTEEIAAIWGEKLKKEFEDERRRIVTGKSMVRKRWFDLVDNALQHKAIIDLESRWVATAIQDALTANPDDPDNLCGDENPMAVIRILANAYPVNLADAECLLGDENYAAFIDHLGRWNLLSPWALGKDGLADYARMIRNLPRGKSEIFDSALQSVKQIKTSFRKGYPQISPIIARAIDEDRDARPRRGVIHAQIEENDLRKLDQALIVQLRSLSPEQIADVIQRDDLFSLFWA